MTSRPRAGWLVLVALIVLSIVPVVAGAVRLGEITGGTEVTPANARFLASPIPVVVHIVTASVFCLLGAVQFSAGVRRRWPRWHRVAGRITVAAGIAAALSGLWMTYFYPHAPGDGDLLKAFRYVFGSAMAVSIVIAFAAILKRNVPKHQAWMIRGYAIGQGAGTQVLIFLTSLAFVPLVGEPDETGRALLLGAGWVINIGFAEWLIRRPSVLRARTLAPG